MNQQHRYWIFYFCGLVFGLAGVYTIDNNIGVAAVLSLVAFAFWGAGIYDTVRSDTSDA